MVEFNHVFLSGVINRRKSNWNSVVQLEKDICHPRFPRKLLNFGTFSDSKIPKNYENTYFAYFFHCIKNFCSY